MLRGPKSISRVFLSLQFWTLQVTMLLMVAGMLLTGCGQDAAVEPQGHVESQAKGEHRDQGDVSGLELREGEGAMEIVREIAEDEAEPGRAKIITYNCLTTHKVKVDSAAGRKGYSRGECLRDFLNVNRPDSIGLQEITDEWEIYIEEELLGYEYDCGIVYYVAGLRSDRELLLQSGSQEFSPILYRGDLYDAVAMGGGWFSDTPTAPSKYESFTDADGNEHSGMKYNRVYSYVVLTDKRTGENAYVHVNCHFDHKSDDYVNVLCSTQLAEVGRELGQQYGCPVVMTGDFNAHEDTDCYAYLADGDNGFYDAKYLTENRSENGTIPRYWYDYSEATAGTPIDHIFVSAGIVRTVEQDVLSNKYFSDHSAMMAILELNKEPDLVP